LGQATNENNREFLLKCLLLWGFCLLERERFGSIDLRKALQKEIVLLSEELTGPSLLATDALVPSPHITGCMLGSGSGGVFE
jgi:hypothetical protein